MWWQRPFLSPPPNLSRFQWQRPFPSRLPLPLQLQLQLLWALLWALAIEVATVAAPVRMGWASSDLASGWWESVCPVELAVDARRLGYADLPPLPAALVADYRRRVAAYDAALVAAVPVVPAVPADAAARIDRARAAATALGLLLRAAAESAVGGAS